MAKPKLADPSEGPTPDPLAFAREEAKRLRAAWAMGDDLAGPEADRAERQLAAAEARAEALRAAAAAKPEDLTAAIAEKEAAKP